MTTRHNSRRNQQTRLLVGDRFVDPATGTRKGVVALIVPGRQGQTKRSPFGVLLMGLPVSLSIFCTAVLAEPAITQIKKVVGLSHAHTQGQTVVCPSPFKVGDSVRELLTARE